MLWNLQSTLKDGVCRGSHRCVHIGPYSLQGWGVPWPCKFASDELIEEVSFQFLKPHFPWDCQTRVQWWSKGTAYCLGTGEFPLPCGLCLMALEQWTELSLPAVRHLAWIPLLLSASVALMFLLCVLNRAGTNLPLSSAIAGAAGPPAAQSIFLLAQWACPLGACLPLGKQQELELWLWKLTELYTNSISLIHLLWCLFSACTKREGWRKCYLSHWKVFPGPKYLIYWPCCGTWTVPIWIKKPKALIKMIMLPYAESLSQPLAAT